MYNLVRIFKRTYKILYAIIVISVLLRGTYEGVLIIIDWLNHLDIQLPNLLEFNFSNIIFQIAMVLGLSGIGYLALFYPLKFLYKFLVPKNNDSYDSDTFIAITKSIDYDNFDFIMRMFWKSFGFTLMGSLSWWLIDSTELALYIVIACSVLAIGIFALALLNYISARNSIITNHSYYAQSMEFNNIASQYCMGSYEKEELLKEIARLPSDCLDHYCANIMKQKLEGIDIKFPFDQFAFGIPPGKELEDSIKDFEEYIYSDIRVG